MFFVGRVSYCEFEIMANRKYFRGWAGPYFEIEIRAHRDDYNRNHTERELLGGQAAGMQSVWTFGRVGKHIDKLLDRWRVSGSWDGWPSETPDVE